MYLIFIDEAGHSGPDGRFFSVGGLIVHDCDALQMRREFRSVKESFGLAAGAEIKWRDLIRFRGPAAHLDPSALEHFLASASARFSRFTHVAVTTVDKEQLPGSLVNDAYLQALGVTLVLAQVEPLVRHDAYLVVVDHRTPNQDHRLRTALAKTLEWGRGSTELLFFQNSRDSVGLQLADMVVGAVHQRHDRGNDRYARAIASWFADRSPDSLRYPWVGWPPMPTRSERLQA